MQFRRATRHRDNAMASLWVRKERKGRKGGATHLYLRFLLLCVLCVLCGPFAVMVQHDIRQCHGVARCRDPRLRRLIRPTGIGMHATRSRFPGSRVPGPEVPALPAPRSTHFSALNRDSMRLGAFFAEAALLVFLVLAVVALVELHVRVAFEGDDVRGDAVQEPAVMRDDQGAARELQQRVFERAQGFDVEVVGRFVEQQHVAALQQGLRHVQAAAFTARQRADQLLLVGALEVEAADVGARLDLHLADGDDVAAAGHFLPDVLVAVQRVAALVHVGDLHRVADVAPRRCRASRRR